jgi:hypothetical protein
METEDVDFGRSALAELQALILRARQLAAHGANLEVIYGEQQE